jgi:hypothetical protein
MALHGFTSKTAMTVENDREKIALANDFRTFQSDL